ncbi:isoleucine--tRNA ligase [Pacificimonas flava]|uniref:Isoleucine--tRNA ligase n=3 Tax=Pacificimonas TaxID=1960290 RepID=A0A219B107_9SPHN|nr:MULTISPECIES: isoleucine--tRNA ligase [Pacificimonas]MBZ6380063.1 isoleucine--tRNA ligase [Pacificimonas aurantium]OWV32032.1 isoleucine--tRNA ligase [Pacificimonas flava]
MPSDKTDSSKTGDPKTGESGADAPDYRDTVFLPKTDFPMKAGLAKKEPDFLARWEKTRLYDRLRKARADREKWILHDGPPYANGDIHIGHALNKILKDITVRMATLKGYDAPYTPGWDCHGLPIEWKIEEQYRKKKKDKRDVDPVEFRRECRAFAEKWVEVQSAQFQRLGIMGTWDRPYLTMDYDAEATIVDEFLKVAGSGLLYKGAKPVMWSPVEQTALAEAEVEYQDITSTQIDVAFEITEAPNAPELVGAHAVIWTTTPWTIPVNQALAYGEDIKYWVAERDGRRFIYALDLEKEVLDRLPKAEKHDGLGLVEPSGLVGAVARHPLADDSKPAEWFFNRPRPLLPGDFVTTDSGTGLVHMAPDHGEDDFRLCRDYDIHPEFVVDGAGRYRDDWPVVGGQHVYKVNDPDGPVCNALRDAGALLSPSKESKPDYQHSYPHSWRSKAKLIYRCTPQWFVRMDDAVGGAQTLRETALQEIDKTRFVPERGYRRLKSMVEGRPDWVLSRQRAWGVPLTLYVHRETGEFLQDAEVNARIVEAVKEAGADAWFTADHQQLLGDAYDAADYEPVTDILDVWFDSGSTHAFVLESGKWPELRSPADLYLEGSDQHRGWFQSSLLESCATRGHAPYKQLLTHGMTLDKDGRKQSKSLGNTTDPKQVVDVQGADILRLWVASVDFTEDHRIGDEIIRGVSDRYRKLRNTFRYLLGALADYDPAEAVAPADMPELERWVLHRLTELDAELRRAAGDYDWTDYVGALETFAVRDLSSFYFDVRKDSLYCDAQDDPRRRACRTVLDILYGALVRWAAPILCFTAEEVWQARYPSEDGSVHFEDWPQIDAGWHDEALAEKWDALRKIRGAVTEAIEPLRREKTIRSSNEADVALVLSDTVDLGRVESVDFAELAIVSRVSPTTEAIGGAEQSETYPEAWVRVDRTELEKCARCWRHTPDVDTGPQLCRRCREVLAE